MSFSIVLAFLAAHLGITGHDTSFTGILYIILAWPTAAIVAAIAGRHIGRFLSSLLTLGVL